MRTRLSVWLIPLVLALVGGCASHQASPLPPGDTEERESEREADGDKTEAEPERADTADGDSETPEAEAADADSNEADSDSEAPDFGLTVSAECTAPDTAVSQVFQDVPAVPLVGYWRRADYTNEGMPYFASMRGLLYFMLKDQPSWLYYLPQHLESNNCPAPVQGLDGKWVRSNYAADSLINSWVMNFETFNPKTRQWETLANHPMNDLSDPALVSYVPDLISHDQKGRIWTLNGDRLVMENGGNLSFFPIVTSPPSLSHSWFTNYPPASYAGGVFWGGKYCDYYNRVGNPAIVGYYDGDEAIRLIWMPTNDEWPRYQDVDSNPYDTIWHLSLDQSTGEFYALGPMHEVHGFIQQPEGIKTTLENNGCAETACPENWFQPLWVDWPSRTLYKATRWGEDANHVDTVYQKQIGADTWTPMSKVNRFLGTRAYDDSWGYDVFLGHSLNDLYLTSDSGVFHYDRGTNSWPRAFSPAPFESWESLEFAYFRDMSLVRDAAGHYRAVTVGVDMPVLMRHDCHDWRELYPNSTGARAVADTGYAVFTAGLDNAVYRWTPKGGVVRYEGPQPAWTAAQEIRATADEQLLLIAWHDSTGQDRRLWYHPGQNPSYKASRKSFAEQWMEVPWTVDQPNLWRPGRLYAMNGRFLILSYSNAFAEQPVPETTTRVYAWDPQNPLNLAKIAELSAYVRLRQHEGTWYAVGSNGAYRLNTSTWALESILPTQNEAGTAIFYYDVVPLDDHRYAGLSDLYSFFVYDTQTRQFEYYQPVVNWGVDSWTDDHADWVNRATPYWEYTLAAGLQKLPTGEILIASGQGNIVTRVSDHEWQRGSKGDGDTDGE